MNISPSPIKSPKGEEYKMRIISVQVLSFSEVLISALSAVMNIEYSTAFYIRGLFKGNKLNKYYKIAHRTAEFCTRGLNRKRKISGHLTLKTCQRLHIKFQDCI